MDKTMLGAFFWNLGAWFAWGIFVLILRFVLERQQQKIAAAEAQAALEA
jgi:heme exporter protein C